MNQLKGNPKGHPLVLNIGFVIGHRAGERNDAVWRCRGGGTNLLRASLGKIWVGNFLTLSHTVIEILELEHGCLNEVFLGQF